MVKLVDMPDLGSGAARRVGSSPIIRTKSFSIEKLFLCLVFLGCDLGSHVLPEGWNPWVDERFPDKTKTTYYEEYKNRGKGAKTNKRIAWSHSIV